MSFTILPYVERDGIRTVTDSTMKTLWLKTVQEDLHDIIFYEGTITSEDQFLAMAKASGTMFYLLFDDNDLVGYTWLNRFENKSARMHYCVFKHYWGQTLEIGKFVLNKLLTQPLEDNTFLFDLLTGFVPAWNKKAINFSLKCGGKTYGEIPNAIYNAKTKQSEPAVFIYYTRGDV